MHLHTPDENTRRAFDEELISIADYVTNAPIKSELAYQTARYCLMDAMGCAILALQFPQCTKLLGPFVPGTTVPKGARVPGTSYILDPVQAAFNIGSMIRWLDYNDTWLAAEWAHPSDNLGAILAVADFEAQRKKPLLMRDVLTAMIKAYEIQGILALENGFNRLGIDHVVFVKIASAALASHLMGGTQDDLLKTLSQAWIDGQSLRTYRHAPNTGSRKSWAAGDATSRAVWLAWLTQRGEMGYPSALTAKTWGLYDTTLRGQSLKRARPYDSYVMENILFKVAFPAEFHAQTAVECAIQLHPQLKNKLQLIDKITIETQEPAVRIISKTGPLHNPADRDHCLQYMVAAALLEGDLKADYYEDQFAKNPELDRLRGKMQVQENPQFTADYFDPEKRSIGNSLQIFFKDASATKKVSVEYPIGHKRRRKEAIPLLIAKFKANLAAQYSVAKIEKLAHLFNDQKELEAMPVTSFLELFAA